MFQTLLEIDTALLIQMRQIPLQEYAVVVQITGESIVLWIALYLLYLWFSGLIHKDREKKEQALQIFFGIILTFTVHAIVNFGIPQWRPSPQDVISGIAPLIPHPLDNSFPSGHALFSAAALIGLSFTVRKQSILFITLIFTLLTAFARVTGGVHYPGDILGGWILGGGASYLIHSLLLEKSWWNHQINTRIIQILSLLKL